MLAAIEHRFGLVNRCRSPSSGCPIMADCYVAGETRRFARDIGLEPRTTPIESPQSIGMAEAFVRTIKRDYVHADRECTSNQLGLITTTRSPPQGIGYRSPVSSLQLTEARDRVQSFGGHNTFRKMG